MVTSVIGKFLSLTFFRMACVVAGPFFINTIWYFLVIGFIFVMREIHKFTYCIAFSVVNRLLFPVWIFSLIARNIERYFLRTVFPHIYVFGLTIRVLTLLHVPSFMIVIIKNILALVVMFLPFYFNFVINQSILRFIILNVYAVISLVFYLSRQGRLLI